MEVCRIGNTLSIKNIDIKFEWIDEIDAKSFAESWDDIKGNAADVNLIGLELNWLEGWVDLLADKIADLDYDVTIPLHYVDPKGATGVQIPQ
jgi:hypothetical protein